MGTARCDRRVARLPGGGRDMLRPARPCDSTVGRSPLRRFSITAARVQTRSPCDTPSPRFAPTLPSPASGRPVRGKFSCNDDLCRTPLFLREIVRFLEQRGALGAGLDGAAGALPRAIRIPEGVTEVIGRRLNFLSAGCNEVLALASVIG